MALVFGEVGGYGNNGFGDTLAAQLVLRVLHYFSQNNSRHKLGRVLFAGDMDTVIRLAHKTLHELHDFVGIGDGRLQRGLAHHKRRRIEKHR